MIANIEIEQQILGSIISNFKLMNEVVDKIECDDFYDTGHQMIYSAMCSLFLEGKEISVVQIAEEIGQDKLKSVGGVSYLSRLECCAYASSLKSYIDVFKDKSNKRKAVKVLQSGIRSMKADGSSYNKIIGNIMNKLMKNIQNKKAILNDSNLLEGTLSEIEVRIKNGGEIPGMKSGFSSLDYTIGGFQRGELCVIAGRPSMGKTLFALNIADGLGDNGYKVLLFELEMTEKAIGMRRLSYKAGVDAERMKFGKLTEEQMVKLISAKEMLSKRNTIFTDCTAGQSLINIKAKAKLLKEVEGLDVVIIDHLTLMNIPEKHTRDIAIGEVTRGLKDLAKELNICVILLSQLSRGVEQRYNKRPLLSDLRESGNIEQDADLVAFVYRDEYYNVNSKEKGILECIISKQRNGRIGTIKFDYNDRYQRISELKKK